MKKSVMIEKSKKLLMHAVLKEFFHHEVFSLQQTPANYTSTLCLSEIKIKVLTSTTNFAKCVINSLDTSQNLLCLEGSRNSSK